MFFHSNVSLGMAEICGKLPLWCLKSGLNLKLYACRIACAEREKGDGRRATELQKLGYCLQAIENQRLVLFYRSLQSALKSINCKH